MESAIRLSPRDPISPIFMSIVGTRRSASVISTPRSTNFVKRSTWLDAFSVYMPLAAAYALAGKVDEAKAALAEARRLEPKLTVKWMTEYMHNPPAVLDGVRKAGLAEK